MRLHNTVHWAGEFTQQRTLNSWGYTTPYTGHTTLYTEQVSLHNTIHWTGEFTQHHTLDAQHCTLGTNWSLNRSPLPVSLPLSLALILSTIENYIKSCCNISSQGSFPPPFLWRNCRNQFSDWKFRGGVIKIWEKIRGGVSRKYPKFLALRANLFSKLHLILKLFTWFPLGSTFRWGTRFRPAVRVNSSTLRSHK